MEIEEYEYDAHQRMKYNPEFHFNQGKKFTQEELEYLCKYYEYEINRDHRRSLSFALGRTEQSIAAKVKNLKQYGLYEFYKNRSLYY